MALILDRVTVRAGGTTLLDGVRCGFRPGRVTAVLGPNGAGKSTLLRAAAGLIACEGSVALDGAPIAALAPRARARLIGYLPQDAAVHWNMRVAEVVALGRHPHAASAAQDAAAIAQALAATATAAFAARGIATLSGGERARALLARVLAGAPRYLLADEPLAALDPAHQADLVARLRAVARADAAVVVVVHDLVQAQLAADDAVLLDHGRVVAAGTASEVLTPDRLGDVFGIRLGAVEAQVEAGGRRLWVPVGR